VSGSTLASFDKILNLNAAIKGAGQFLVTYLTNDPAYPGL
jgi:hypothetical protein